jgi:hypothetical protein
MLMHYLENKLEILLEHVFLSFEFMLAKALLKEMDFVVDLQSHINEIYIWSKSGQICGELQA